MKEPEGFDKMQDGPQQVRCGKCRKFETQPTLAFSMTATGVAEQLYLCRACGWGTVIRYDPKRPRFYVAHAVVTPGKTCFGYVLPKRRKDGK